MRMHVRGNSYAHLLFIVWLIGGIVYLFRSVAVEKYLGLYFVCLISYFAIGLLFFARKYRTEDTIFDSFTLITLLYIIMMFVVPMEDLIAGNYYTSTAGSVDVFPYGIKATFVFDFGYLAYYLGYDYRHRHSFEDTVIDDSGVNYNQTALNCLAVWIVSFLSAVLYLMSTGKNLAYIISAGINGAIDQDLVSETPLMFLSVPSHMMIPTAFMYCKYGKNKLLKFFLIFLTLDYFWLRGFRYIIIIMAWSAVIIYYTIKQKKPRVVSIILLVIILVAVIGIVGGARNAVRSGREFDLSGSETAFEQALDNFRIYKTYYAVVKACPSLVPFNFLEQIVVYTIIMFIPRAIWPGKPTSPVNIPIAYGLSAYSSQAGAAYPNVGEYYYSAGFVGVIFFMCIYGMWNRKLEQKICREINTGQLIVYSVILASNFQLIIRGYTPGNFYMLLFMLLPTFLISKNKRFDV